MLENHKRNATMLKITRVKANDCELIQDIVKINAEELKEGYINANELPEIFSDNGQIFLVARWDDEVVGFLHCNFKVSDNTELLSIAVASRYQKNGIASKMFNVLLNELTSHNVNKIYLEVAEQNYKAIALYKRLKFVEYNRRSKYYENGDNAICMFLNIN